MSWLIGSRTLRPGTVDQPGALVMSLRGRWKRRPSFASIGIWSLTVPAPLAWVTLQLAARPGQGLLLGAKVEAFQYSDVRVRSLLALSASCPLNHAATSRLLVGIHRPLR